MAAWYRLFPVHIVNATSLSHPERPEGGGYYAVFVTASKHKNGNIPRNTDEIPLPYVRRKKTAYTYVLQIVCWGEMWPSLLRSCPGP
jgi:hypothetical protein